MSRKPEKIEHAGHLQKPLQNDSPPFFFKSNLEMRCASAKGKHFTGVKTCKPKSEVVSSKSNLLNKVKEMNEEQK